MLAGAMAFAIVLAKSNRRNEDLPMAEHGEYELGSQDITEHKRQWETFTKLATYSTVATLAVVFILMFIFG